MAGGDEQEGSGDRSRRRDTSEIEEYVFVGGVYSRCAECGDVSGVEAYEMGRGGISGFK